MSLFFKHKHNLWRCFCLCFWYYVWTLQVIKRCFGHHQKTHTHTHQKIECWTPLQELLMCSVQSWISIQETGQRQMRGKRTRWIRPPPSSQSLAVKEFCFLAHEIRQGFFVKFLVPTFPGTLKDENRQNIFFGEIFYQNFALRAFAPKMKGASKPQFGRCVLHDNILPPLFLLLRGSQISPELLESPYPKITPHFPRSSLATSPELLSLWHLKTISTTPTPPY